MHEVNEESDQINVNVNAVDPLGRSALLMAIDNENLDMVELLINYKVDTKDALLHAISEEFVEAVEMLLDHEDQNERKEGQHVSKTNLVTKRWTRRPSAPSSESSRQMRIILHSIFDDNTSKTEKKRRERQRRIG